MKQLKRLNGEVIFEYGSQDEFISGVKKNKSNLSGSDLRDSNLSGSDLRDSNLSGSDLSESDLSESDLRWSNLSGSDLRWSNLRWTNLRGLVGNGREIKTIIIGIYHVNYTKHEVWIGCKHMTISKWKLLSKEVIKGMDNEAEEFNNKYRDIILQIIESFPAE